MTAHRLKVLLIEDNPGDALLVEEYLADHRDPAFELKWVNRLAAGLESLATGDIDVVLLDLGLPDSQGKDTFLRVHAQAPKAPIVVLSGLADEPLALWAVQEGAQDYLVKGDGERGLLARSLRHAIERQRGEESLRESEQRYRQLLGSVTDYIYTVQVENGVPVATSHSAGCVAVTGYVPAEYTADPHLWLRMIHDGDRPAALEQAARVLAGGAASPLEHRIIHKNGSVRWIRNTPVLHRDAQGGVASYDGLISDVTERKRAEEALQASQALYQSLVETIPLQVFRKDREGRITFANKRFCDMLGRSLEQVLGKTARDFYPAALAEKYLRDDLQVMASAQVLSDTEVHPRSNGDRLVVAVVKTPVYDADKAVVGTQGFFWDITDLQWADEQKSRMRGARAIQQKLFPVAAPRVAGFDVGGAAYPAEATGGDFFDYILAPDGFVDVILGDVSSHGFGPALLAAVTHSCLRTLALTRVEMDVAAILAACNRLLHEDTGGEHFVTLAYARLDPHTRSLVYASAGHPPGYILDPSGRIKTRLTSTGPPLGVFAEEAFPGGPAVRLEPGELVLLVSDGVQEAMAPDGTLFGIDRALEVVRAHRHQSAQEIVDALCLAARNFYEGGPQHDDVTVVVIKADPAP